VIVSEENVAFVQGPIQFSNGSQEKILDPKSQKFAKLVENLRMFARVVCVIWSLISQ